MPSCKNFPTPKTKKGFSLIEVLIAVFVVLVLISILLTTATTLTQARSTNLQTIASKIASSEIEKLRETSFASLPSSGSVSDPNLSKLPSGTETLTISNYQSDSTIKVATVTVSWLINSSPRQSTIETLIYQNGI